MKLRAILGALLVGALFAPAAASAQDPPQVDRPELERRVRARFGETVRSELGISEEQLERVQSVESSFQQARQALIRREIALRRRMVPRASQGITEDEAGELLREMAAVREEEARLYRAEMDGLLGVLTPPQALRFYQLREQLMERVRRVRGGAAGRGGPPGPRGRLPGGG
jgi:Spy/CpxP family protein refolding chaperone